MIFDTHCHLDLFDNMKEMISDFERYKGNTGIFAVGTTPFAFQKDRAFFQKISGIRVGLGFHPQLISSGYDDFQLFCKFAKESQFIGEVGLDFSARYIKTKEQQKKYFESLVGICEEGEEKTISLHSLKSTSTVLDILERYKKQNDNIYIFHWFTGSLAQLRRALVMGCYFSINAEMTSTKSGVEIIKTLPVERLLLETDAPFTGSIESVGELSAELENLCNKICGIKGQDISDAIERNTKMVLRI